MESYTFSQKNSGTIVIVQALTFEEAEKELFDTVKDDYGWRFQESTNFNEED